jgi:hypothetical protein
VKGQIRGSTSAWLGAVQGGSRRMRPPRFLPTGHGGGVHVLPRFRPPDLCSIRTTGEQDELAEVLRSGFGAAGSPLGDDYPPVPLTSGIDRAIRLSTAAAVLAVAGIAAYVSYWHAAVHCATMAATGGGFSRRGGRDIPAEERQRAARVAGRSAIPASGQRGQALPEAGAVNDAAVAAYRLSAQAGNPLSERKLARCSGAHPAAGRAQGSPKHGEPRLQGSPWIRQSPSARNPRSAPRPGSSGDGPTPALARLERASWSARGER